MNRQLEKDVRADLSEKMVFVGGPRQVGKTTLALQILGGADERHPAYLNWDDPETRRMLIEGALPPDEPLVVFDEIHKYKHWRNLVKGFYDRNKGEETLSMGLVALRGSGCPFRKPHRLQSAEVLPSPRGYRRGPNGADVYP